MTVRILAALAVIIVMIVLFVAGSGRPGAHHARRPRPPVDGAPPAWPGAVLPLADMPTIEPPITPSALVRPFVTHLDQVLASPATVPFPTPGRPNAKVNGHPLLAIPSCGLCRDGSEVIGASCIVCGRIGGPR
jgi:hypothetical protein